MARAPKIPSSRPKPPRPGQVKQDDLEKYELKQPREASLAHPEQPDDHTEKIPLAVKRELDQKAQINDVFDRNETIHDVTHPDFGALADGTTDAEPAFTLAIAALSAGDALYIPRGIFKLSDNVTIPAGNALIFESGAKISIDTTKTFTVNSTLTADSHQIFDGAGTIDISGMELGADITEIDPVWFGNSVVTLFTDQDATPSVNRGRLFKTANTVATTITNFNDGIAGQMIRVVCNDAFTTVDFSGTNLKGNGGVDWTPIAGDNAICTFDGTDWFCTVCNDPNDGSDSGTNIQHESISIWTPAAVQADQDAIPFCPIESDWAASGITVRKFGIKTWPASTYTAVLEEWTSPTDGAPSTVATASTSGTSEAEDASPADPDIAAGSILMIDLPTTDITFLQVWMTYTVD